ncbi:MAG: FtsX-like permease family protein [Polyangiales bacterium]
MRHLIRYIALRHLTASPGRTLLTLLGITLGVALVFAIELVNGSVLASFRQSVDQMAGKTALIVGDGTGVDEELLDVIKGVEGVEVAAPVIQESMRDTRTGAQLAVLAVDSLTDRAVRDYEGPRVQIGDELAFLNDPRGLLVSTSYAKKHGLREGATMALETLHGPATFTVRGMLAPTGPLKVFGGDVVMMDVFAAQIAFERGRRFDRVDIVPSEGSDVEVLAERIRGAISQRATVNRPQQRAADAEQIVAGFRLGLSIASLVAMMVGGFIVYNALAIAVAQRRREIGILRALGATRGQIVALFVGEGVLLGAVGSCLGVMLGLLLGRSTLQLVAASISEMYVAVQSDELFLTPRQFVIGAAVGVGTSFAAALLPARRASAVEPASAMRKTVVTADGGLTTARRAGLASLGFALLAAVVAYVAHQRSDFVLGAGVSVFLAFSVAFITPLLARWISALARRLARGQPPAVRLGVLSFERNSVRNAIAIAALAMALGNVVNIGCFLESIKVNTQHWFDRTLKSDIVVFAGEKVGAKIEHPLPGSMLGELAALPGVEFVNPLRMARQSLQGKPYYLFAYNLPEYSRHDEVPVVEGELASALVEIEAGRGLAASEQFSKEFNVHLGDQVTLQTPQGPRAFRIALVYVDYSAELGILTTTREVYLSIWKDTLVDWYGLYLRPGTAMEPLRARISRELGKRHQLMVLGNADYKAEVLATFDRSFTLMRAMELVALIVALLGIVNTLVVSVIDRTVELGILKAIGAVRQQVRSMFVVEAFLIGLAAAVLGLVAGVGFSLYTVKELLRFQMGWQIEWQLSLRTVLETVAAAQLVALLGAWFPTRSASELDVVDALGYE